MVQASPKAFLGGSMAGPTLEEATHRWINTQRCSKKHLQEYRGNQFLVHEAGQIPHASTSTIAPKLV